ncbi:MAG: GGDEF domain-containing protein [Lachnospiraceae bacterium]|nr:GGDEF domain-containing protein [Lachnospiraceae bacterium]
MSIKKSLQNSIIFMSVIPVILMAILAYVVSTTKYAQINIENTKLIAQDYSYGLNAQLKTQLIETSALANLNDTKSYFLEKINTPDVLLNTSSNYYSNIKNTITQISNNYNNNVNYYIYDIDGYLVISSSDDNISDWTEIMTQAISSYKDASIINHSLFTDNTIDIVSPIIVQNETIGLIRTNISAEYFENYLSTDNSNIGFVVDNTGKPLFGYDASSDNDQAFLAELLKINNNSNITNSVIAINNEYNYGFAHIDEHHLTYVIKHGMDNFTNIVSSLPIIFMILLIIVIILSIQISHGLAEKYTQPIVELSENMKTAASGELNVHCNINSDDEFGILSNSFNQMMDIISTNYNEAIQSKMEAEVNKQELQLHYDSMERLAYTDTLTGLYNRAAFFKFANAILSNNKMGLKNHAIIFIDLDGFKSINDTLGHDYGDLLLKAVSAKFSSFISEDDILARNGGDEFVILRNQFGSIEDLELFLKKLISISSHPFMLEDETVHISLSAGVALFPQNGLSLSELMKNADIAMYASKNTGKNSYTFFSSTMEDEVNRKNDLIDILRDAISNKDVYLLYQPQADIKTGEIIGCEALMRLNSPIVGFVSPDEFIPVAEECGLIDELGEWALLEACSFNQRLIEAGFKPICISVNVSTSQLRSDRLLKTIESLPQKTSMSLKYLEIELTESVLMTNFNHNLALINRMKELGVKIALDDFGTGYSSFSYLTRIPINTLKIDKSFIAGICNNKNDAYIAGTIINLAHQLDITVIAEGVETIEQLRILQNQTCDILQGYFFSRAISEDDFIELLKINS